MTDFHTPGPITLAVELAAGTVDVSAGHTDRSRVELRPAKPDDAEALALIERARVALDGETLVVHVPDGRRGLLLRRAPEIDVRIAVPTGSRLDVATKSADVRAHGSFAEGRLATASGDVAVTEVTGDLSIDAASGDLRVGIVGGDARVKTASGDVSIDEVAGGVRASSASGDIRAGDIGDDLEAKTASGDVAADAVGGSATVRTASGDVRIGGLGAGRTAVSTVSGDVAVRVAPELAVWLDVSSVSGDVRSTLDSADDAREGSVSTLELAVRTISGDITIEPSGRLPQRRAS